LTSPAAQVMKAHAEAFPQTYFYFDLLTSNLHKSRKVDEKWWAAYKSAIQGTGKLIVVLAPWRDPTPLKRAWCLWEIMCALSNPDRVEFLVRLPPRDLKDFQEGCMNNFRDAMAALVGAQVHNLAEKENVVRSGVRGNKGPGGEESAKGGGGIKRKRRMG